MILTLSSMAHKVMLNSYTLDYFKNASRQRKISSKPTFKIKFYICLYVQLDRFTILVFKDLMQTFMLNKYPYPTGFLKSHFMVTDE